MQVSTVDFIKSPAFYLKKVSAESIVITEAGRPVAVLAKPSDTPIANSLVGILKGANIESADDIKAMRLNV